MPAAIVVLFDVGHSEEAKHCLKTFYKCTNHYYKYTSHTIQNLMNYLLTDLKLNFSMKIPWIKNIFLPQVLLDSASDFCAHTYQKSFLCQKCPFMLKKGHSTCLYHLEMWRCLEK